MPDPVTEQSPAREPDELRRRILLLFLPLVVLAIAYGGRIIAGLPGTFASEPALFFLYSLVAAGCFLILAMRPDLTERIALTTAALMGILFLQRITSLVYGPMVDDPAFSLFRPIYAFLPLAYFSFYFLLQARAATLLSVGLWLLVLLVVGLRLGSDWAAFADREGARSLLLYLVVGNPLFIVLLSLVPAMERQLVLARDSVRDLEREVGESAQIAEARRRLAAAVDGSRDVLWELPDVQGGDAWFSPRLLEVTGFEADQVKPGFPGFLDLVHPADARRLVAALNGDGEGRNGIEMEIRLRTRRYGYRWFAVRAVVSGGEDGVRHAAGSLQDIQQRKLLDEKLLASREAMNVFAHLAAHDLRGPTQRIAMLAERARTLLRQDPPQMDKVNDSMDRIVRNALGAGDLINALLDYAEASRPRREEAVELDAILGHVSQTLAATARERGAVIEVDGSLPRVLGHGGDIVVLFEQLLNNALKFCTGSPRIHVSAELYSDAAVVSVADNGIGIPQDQIFRVFEPMEHLHSQEEYPGHGLGLTIARKIVEKYQGQIWAESMPGKGTVVRVRLRLAPEDGVQSG